MAFDRTAYYRNWRKQNKDRYKIIKMRYEMNQRNQIFDMLGRKCIRCGFDDIRALQIDHVNGDGYKDKPFSRGSSSHRKRIIESIKNGELRYQILCANCNWIKRCENKEHTRHHVAA